MILCDVNIFIHAHRADNPHHPYYRSWLEALLASTRTWAYCDLDNTCKGLRR